MATRGVNASGERDDTTAGNRWGHEEAGKVVRGGRGADEATRRRHGGCTTARRVRRQATVGTRVERSDRPKTREVYRAEKRR